MERLGAVARLEQERAARRHLGRALAWSCRASPAKTSGGIACSRARAVSAARLLGPLGLVLRGCPRQEDGTRSAATVIAVPV